MEYVVAADGLMAFEARATNAGGLAAEDVAISAAWTVQPDDGGIPGSAERAAAIERIEPGASETATLLLPIPTGAYDLTLSAETASLEAVTDDNAVEAPIEVEYVHLVVATSETFMVASGVVRMVDYVTAYGDDGDGIVEVPLRVTNEGVSASGPLTVGALCDGAPPACSTSTTLDSLPAGGSADATHPAAGRNPRDRLRRSTQRRLSLGERNTLQAAIFVPSKPPVALALDATVNVLGYWSDGTAEVEFALSLGNAGYRPVEDALAIAVTCYRDDGPPMGDCGGAVDSVALRNGFGPAERVTRLRVPMGVELRAALPDGAAKSDNSFTVPERILGVDRDVWECFSDRPD